jgi:hypothetical protein
LDIHTLCSLTVFKNLLKNEIINNYYKTLDNKYSLESLGALYSSILDKNAEDSIFNYISDIVIKDINIFSLRASNGEKISDKLIKAYLRDLNILYDMAEDIVNLFNIHLPSLALEKGNANSLFKDKWSNTTTINNLLNFYKNNGFGNYAYYKAFKLFDNELIPLKNTSSITLESLKEYSDEKKQIAFNIEAFLKGLPFANMLLYGDKGTGKSSTVHAMLNNYYSKGLRLVELPKSQIPDLIKLFEILPKKPLKFIIFIDDLAMSDKEDNFSLLKAALEGSVTGQNKNIMVCATSNRRHIISESFADRDNNVHFRDTMQEQLSLADRFGLAVLFDSPDKKLYLDIVFQLCNENKIVIEKEQLTLQAERFATLKGGRSPRRAKQFVDMLIAEKGINK